MPFYEKANEEAFFISPAFVVKLRLLADLDQFLVDELGEELEYVVSDHPGRGFVALAQFVDQFRYEDGGGEAVPHFAADFAESVTATALEAHEDGFSGHIRGHGVRGVADPRCEGYIHG
jgi:hypothetical protein